MTDLALTLRKFGDEVEASLAYQGYDLLDLWRGRMSYRRLLVLIRSLPAKAPLWGAVRVAAEREEREAMEAHLRARTEHWKRRGRA